MAVRPSRQAATKRSVSRKRVRTSGDPDQAGHIAGTRGDFVRALMFLAATVVVGACSASPAPSGTASSTAAPPATITATSTATHQPSPSEATGLANPRGSAINGAIIYGAGGDIFSLDPATGATTLVVGGPMKDFCCGLSPDSTRLDFYREDDNTVYMSALDGSGVKPWAKGNEISSWTWSPDGSRIAAISEGGTARDLIIWDGGAGPKRHLVVDAPANGAPFWIDDETLLLVQETPTSQDFWTVKADGTGLRPLDTHGSYGFSVDIGTRRLAYSAFAPNVTTASSVHVLDIATGVDSILAMTAIPDHVFLQPKFSPDGKWLVSSHGIAGRATQPVLIAADGSGVLVPLGPVPTKNQFENFTFSPDSTRLLVVREDGAYLFSIPDGAGGRVDWPLELNIDDGAAVWQRLPG